MAITWQGDEPQTFYQKRFAQGMLQLISDVDRLAKGRAPVVTGALKNSGRFKAQGANSVVESFGNARVNYAAKRERGPNRNPATEHYLENAAREVASQDISLYFK